MIIKPKSKRKTKKETIDAPRINELDEKSQLQKIKQKKRRDELEFSLEINRLNDGLCC